MKKILLIRATTAKILLVLALAACAAPVVAVSPKASVIGITYKGGSSSVDVVVAIPAHIYDAAQHANFGLHVAVTYGSVNSTFETIDSGRASIEFDTTFLGFIDDDTVAVLLKVPLGAAPAPGADPAFTSTVELLTPGG